MVIITYRSNISIRSRTKQYCAGVYGRQAAFRELLGPDVVRTVFLHGKRAPKKIVELCKVCEGVGRAALTSHSREVWEALPSYL